MLLHTRPALRSSVDCARQGARWRSAGDNAPEEDVKCIADVVQSLHLEAEPLGPIGSCTLHGANAQGSR
jgi:hypothetical protein